MLVFLLTPNVDIGGEGESLDHPQAATLRSAGYRISNPIRHTQTLVPERDSVY
jgi:hypothetical protein